MGGFGCIFRLGSIKRKLLADVEVINRLAFRASYGATGNNAITFLYQETLNSSNYVSGVGNGTCYGLANLASVYSNKTLTWKELFKLLG
jgi:hypothetical protein